jgi:hypothetical protein
VKKRFSSQVTEVGLYVEGSRNAQSFLKSDAIYDKDKEVMQELSEMSEDEIIGEKVFGF